METVTVMVIKQTKLFFRSARFIFEDEELKRALREKKYSYITGLSYDRSLVRNDKVSKKQKKTPVIKLEGQDLESIYRKFNDTTRNEIHKTEKMQEFRFLLSNKNNASIYGLYSDFEKRGGRPVRKKEYFKESIFAGAYFQDKLIAAIIAYDAKPYIRINAIVSADKQVFSERKYISYATRRLVWEFVGFGKERGYQWIDLGGVNLIEKEKSGIAAFKMSFGGELVDEFTYTYKSKLFRFFRKFISLS